MKEPLEPIVIHAEALLWGDVLLTFEDGSCAVYSTPLLRSMLHLADRFIDKELVALRLGKKPIKGRAPHEDN